MKTNLKKLFLLLVALTTCLSVAAQIRMYDGSTKKSSTHSNTIIVKNIDTRLSMGWHGMVDVSVGPHVMSDSHKGPTIAAAVSGMYECNCGFTAGLTAGYHHWTYKGDSYNDSMNDFRLMAVLGWVFGRNHHNGFILLQPGFSTGATEDIMFSGDVELGYRYMFNSHLGIAVSTGISGIWGRIMSVPLTIGFVF